MPRPKNEIIADIDEQIHRGSGGYAAWCVGVASDPESPLFRTHLVDEMHDGWIYREAFTAESARAVRDYFVRVCGTDANTSLGEEGGRYVYVYKRTSRPTLAAREAQPIPSALAK